MKRVDDSARDFVDFFDQLGVPYALMGGLAVRLYALPRPTFDVDFTALIPRNRLPDLYRLSDALGYHVSDVQSTGWVDTVHGLPVIHFNWFVADRPIDVDVFLAETPFQQQLLDRRQFHGAEDWQAWFVSPEDLILLKLLANRPKDRVDVADILLIQGDLDPDYPRKWGKKLNISQPLENAWPARSILHRSHSSSSSFDVASRKKRLCTSQGSLVRKRASSR